MIRYWLITFALCIGGFMFHGMAQPPPQDRCGTMDALERLIKENPEYKKKLQQIEQHTRKVIRQKRNQRGRSLPDVITIPVVFHVVYNNSSENIPDSMLYNQLEVLNEDFRRLNSDTTDTRSYFQDDASDVKIEFCLAVRDPNGNPTDGITRTSTNHGPFSTNDDVKYDSQGGKDAWPSDEYLNYWVCDLDGLLGYAQFPGGDPATDGVVTDYEYTGRPATEPYHLGRTGTHEVGHWLNLYHTFQDGCVGTDTSNCDSEGDYCCDTPPLDNSSSGCPSHTQNTCTETPTDEYDQWENYMDYTYDSCMNMFSYDQKARMRAIFESGGPRDSILYSPACTPLNQYDASIRKIIRPGSSVCSDTICPKVVIGNEGSDTLNSLDIYHHLESTSTDQYNWSGSLLTGEIDTITLACQVSTNNPDTLTVFTSNPNDTTDQYKANDTASVGFNRVTGQSIPFTEDFEAGFPPSGWVVNNPDGSYTWEQYNVNNGPNGTSTQTAHINHWNYSGGGEEDELITYYVDLTGTTQPMMTFDIAYARYSDSNSERLQIFVKSGCEGNYVEEYNKSGKDADGNTLPTVGSDQTSEWFPANSNEWRNDTVDLSAYTGKKVKINFLVTNGYGNNLFIDNINLFDAQTCGSLSVSGNKDSVTCYGGQDGQIEAMPSGGTSPYDYDWSNGDTTKIIDSLLAGSYSVTVTDSESCQATDTFRVSQPDSLTLSTDYLESTCGDNNASAWVTVSGGTPSYSYLWDDSSGQTDDTADNLWPEPYMVTVTDGNGCQDSAGVSVSGTGSPVILLDSLIHVGCHGDSTGSIYVSDSGGTSPYSYSWSNGAITQDLEDVPADTYGVTITDINGCTDRSEYVITQPDSMTLGTDSEKSTCGLDDGKAWVAVSGGTTPYTYQWNDSSAQTTDTAFNLWAGPYTVTVTDANSCMKTASVTVPDEGGATLQLDSLEDPLCYADSTGAIYVSDSGGTAPYTYNWSNGETTEDLINVPAGNYDVTLTDSNDCTTLASYSLTQPDSLTLVMDAEPSTCGQQNGKAWVTVTGGTGGDNYQWNDSSSQTTDTAFNLWAGSYTVTVTDANGCQKTGVVTVPNEEGPILWLDSLQDVRCKGDSSGAIYLSDSGGTTPLSYTWSNGAASQDLTNIPAGSYGVTVSDANGCTDQGGFTVSEPASSLSLMSSSKTATCGWDNGKAWVSATGGTPPYSYLWSDSSGQTTDTAYNLWPGNYTVTVTDTNNCTQTASVTINNEEGPSAWLDSIRHVQCNGEATGAVYISDSAGTSPYSYQWSTGDTTQDLMNVTAGSYSITMTDANNCSVMDSFIINEPTPMMLTTGSEPATGNQNDGVAWVSATGGVAPYEYQWNDPDGQITDTATSLVPDTYQVVVTDANGCRDTGVVTVDQVEGLAIDQKDFQLRLYPNPVQSQLTFDIEQESPERVEVKIYNTLGQQMYEADWMPAHTLKKSVNLRGNSPGLYVVRVQVDDRLYVKRIFVTD